MGIFFLQFSHNQVYYTCIAFKYQQNINTIYQRLVKIIKFQQQSQQSIQSESNVKEFINYNIYLKASQCMITYNFLEQCQYLQDYKIKMYSDYKSASSYYGKIQPQDDHKRPVSSHLDLGTHIQKTCLSKNLRWNIEESKQNFSSHYNYQFASSAMQLSKQEVGTYPQSQYNSKKGLDRSFNDYSKTPTAKSYKTIQFSSQFQNQYQKNKGNFKKYDTYKDYQQKKSDSKGLTMSLGYKTTLKDLVPNFQRQNQKKPNVNLDFSVKKLKSSKSQKRINFQIDNLYSPCQKEPTKNQYSAIKSYKRIAEFLSDNKETPKKEQKQQISTLLTKSSKNIKQEGYRPKFQKAASYKQQLDHQYDTTKIKRHQTTDFQKPISTKNIGSKQKMSIKDFQLGKCAGEGAFGQVFPAIHKQTKMLVAIKKVPKEKVKYMLDQFINQIKIQMFLDHPNIVKLYGFFDDISNFYIIMEYMEGGNVFSLIKKNKKISPQQASQRLKQICLGLKQMHDNSILHRDIKPQNIVLTNNVCKLCDFGWSAICKDRRTTYCGTLDYVSPQIIGGQGYDDSVDIWCIGVLAYEMICGKTPFYNISRKQTMKKIMNVTYEYPPELTGKAKSFVDKILKKNPDDRLDIEQILKDKFLSQ